MRKIRILHISGNQYPPLPANHHTRRIWEELSKECDEYHVFARSNDMSFSNTVDGNIHLHLIPSFSSRMWVFFFLSWLLPYYVIKYKPTHLVAQCPVLGGIAASVCAVIFRLPLFVELHGAHYVEPARPGLFGVIEYIGYRLLSRPAFSVAYRIRSLSDDMSRNVLRVYGQHIARKIAVIPTRVDLDVFSHIKSKYFIDGPINIISVGSYGPRKNHISLLEDLTASGIPFTLTLVGSGQLEEDYINTANNLGVTNRLRIVKNLTHAQLAKLLPSCDLYIHYAKSEGLPRAILEAMAAGLPVIATPVGFIEGILENNKNSLVIKSPWRESLIKYVKMIYASEDLRKNLGVSARKTIEDRFDSKIVYELYRKAICDLPH